MRLPYLNQVVSGDSARLLRELPSDSADLVTTSPPYYKQRDYGGRVGNIEEFIRLLAQPEDVVLDPFAGAGTTAIAALKTDCQYICFDINEACCACARERSETSLSRAVCSSNDLKS